MKILLLFVVMSFSSCSVDDKDAKYENYGDISENNGGAFIIRSKEDHVIGWGQGNCFLCHNVNNIHKVDRSAEYTVDLQGIQKQVREQGLNSCVTCHGPMGRE